MVFDSIGPPDQQPIKRIVGRKVRDLAETRAVSIIPKERIAFARQKTLSKIAPKGVFRYKSHAQANADMEKWVAESVGRFEIVKGQSTDFHDLVMSHQSTMDCAGATTNTKTVFTRPESLYEYSHALLMGNPDGWGLGDFLDAFYGAPKNDRQSMLDPEPEFLRGRIENGEVTDAYLAATAEYLAWHFDFQNPEWTRNPRRFMKEPWFATGISGLKPLLAMESPAAFRRRNLFVFRNALSRA